MSRGTRRVEPRIAGDHSALALIGWPALVALALATALAAGAVAGAAEAPPSTLAELARLALASDESVERAASEVRRTEADLKLAVSVLLPRLELNGSWTRYGEAQEIEFAPGESFVIRPLSDWSWSADLSQTLFYGLRDWRARDVARLRNDVAELERRAAEDDLVLKVANAFFDAVASGENVGVRRSALEQIEAQQRVAERRHEVGEAALADLARWRAEVAAARQELVAAEGSAELARRRLARLAGAPELGELSPPGAIPIPTGNDRELVARALERRLEMQALAHQIEAAGLMIKIERGARLPEVDARAQYFKQKSVFPSPDWTSLTVSVKVPIYDGGLAAARAAKAREDLREVELLESELEKAIRDQVEAAAISYRTTVATLAAAREGLAAAREAHRQVEKAYRVGEASATDLLETTTTLTEAETGVVIARAQRDLEAIALRRAVGEAPLPDLEPTPDRDED